MSKKLFLALSLAVALIGGSVTAFVAVYYSPSNRANRAIANYDTANKIQTNLTQKYYDELVFEKTYLYGKSKNGYNVSENVKSLNPDPLSKEDYTVLKNEYFTETFSLDFFRLKSSYFKNCALTEEKETDLFTFTADVKESKIREFFRSSFPETLPASEAANTSEGAKKNVSEDESVETNENLKIENLSVSVVFDSIRPQSIKISFTLNLSFFTLITTFSYD